jgi:SH3-like domain-containing protein
MGRTRFVDRKRDNGGTRCGSLRARNRNGSGKRGIFTGMTFNLARLWEQRRVGPAAVLVPVMVAGLAMVFGLSGCSRFRAHEAARYVYVTAKQTGLRDRVAAVSNRTGIAYNGEKLVVLERDRRFLEVRTPRGEVGWIEEKMTAGQDVADQFEVLSKANAKDPVVATAAARDDVYLHVAPGLDTARFYRLSEGDAMSLLERATVPKTAAPGAVAQAKPAVVAVAASAKRDKAHAIEGEIDLTPPGPVMEDWWLVRDAKGQTGWIYGRMIDVSEPDTLARYSEGQRIVGAYVLGYADDPDSGVLDNGQTVAKIPEYVTVLSPFKAGLPYDFNQVRVFTWNVKKHRYETAFREKDIAGYLPVKIGMSKDPYGHAEDSGVALPSFTYRVLSGDVTMPTPNPATGLVKPAKTIAKTYRLVGNITQRVIQPGVPPPVEAHPEPEAVKGKRRRR